MAAFHLWHPAYLDETTTLEMFVTCGDAFSLGAATPEFVEEALRSVGVEAQAEAFSLSAARTHYFGSSRNDSTAWKDRWGIAWRLRAELPERPTPAPSPVWGYFDFDDSESAAGAVDPEEELAWPCCVLADAPNAEVFGRARESIGARFPGTSVVVAKAYGRLPQLRCDLGSEARGFYEEGAEAAEALLKELVQLGASVRFDDTLRMARPRR